ncbi:hypothetical protein NM688_g3434 [Phlebia brevispora]|uniref:Uncharacterized protein n=1 Tax=Phlebia brevispora TaxID=194682 RepID=A0ACC1T5J1_9APHY|nr:hypothetical protein NM688_g3434 [Phlebia brevispora]
MSDAMTNQHKHAFSLQSLVRPPRNAASVSAAEPRPLLRTPFTAWHRLQTALTSLASDSSWVQIALPIPVCMSTVIRPTQDYTTAADAMLLHKNSIAGVALDSTGLVALADLSSIKQRTALMGSASITDILFLAPGIHTQQDCTGVNGGELPQAGDMLNDYVFRIENPATVSYLQNIGKPGHLVTVRVEREMLPTHSPRFHAKSSSDAPSVPSLASPPPTSKPQYSTESPPRLSSGSPPTFPSESSPPSPESSAEPPTEHAHWYHAHWYKSDQGSSLIYFFGVALTVVSITLIGIICDFWALAVLLLLLAVRTINTVVVMTCCKEGWKGAPEKEDKYADLIIVLSQDRWVRMQGIAKDIKLVTAGQWLSDPNSFESFAAAFAMLLVYVAAALAINTKTVGNLIVGVLLLANAAILGICNSLTKDLHMFGCRVYRTKGPDKYGKTRWATKMDLLTEDAILQLQQLGSQVNREAITSPNSTLVQRTLLRRPAVPAGP